MHAFRHRCGLWLATCVLVFAVLAPAIAQWRASADDPAQGTVQICTAAGMITLGGSAPADSDDGGQRGSHCLWCKLHVCTGLAAGNPGCLGGEIARSIPATPHETPPRPRFTQHRPDSPRAPPVPPASLA
ncbi:DUF2946 family protein [Rhodocyclus tenuis]|uniref:DUF2946 family protein n=1 Tax=Rhodocyclus tenuis TaxID=1066 RepID=UPI001A92856F|nr:DUF2946 family protein [Rhodocyclus tenuis]